MENSTLRDLLNMSVGTEFQYERSDYVFLGSDYGSFGPAIKVQPKGLGSILFWNNYDAKIIIKKTMPNIKEKFVLALTKEPQKSFRKAGITNGDDLLTDEGTKVFLTWLLHKKYADEFKTEVVDDLLEEEKD